MPMSRRSSCDVATLTDHARGLGSETDRARVEAHVADCAACQADLAALTRLASVARRDETEVPGRAAMQRAFAIAGTAPDPVSSLPHWLGQLIQGGLQPALAGLRSAAAQDQRQAVFHAGPYAVTVRVEDDGGDATCAIIGQITARDTARDVATLPVLATVNGRVLERTETNAHGEFELTCNAVRQLRLQVVVEAGTRRVELPLARLLPTAPDPS